MKSQKFDTSFNLKAPLKGSPEQWAEFKAKYNAHMKESIDSWMDQTRKELTVEPSGLASASSGLQPPKSSPGLPEADVAQRQFDRATSKELCKIKMERLGKFR
ncbi:MAG: hypothetical protein EOO38_05805 [Cytophagaceae bacterium]|nr:MAG: hypothetical protein EOO38_05805 [Cytophagaceae bacterium]